MRVIAGEYRRRALLGPKDDQTTRPITDRVKTALFDRLWAHGWLREDAAVLDLFCGTGSLGIEALSRGAAHVTFAERDRDARLRLEQNLETLSIERGWRLLPGDALSAALPRMVGRTDISLIFLDPPYVMMSDAEDAARVLEQMDRLAEICAERALVVVRTDDQTDVPATSEWGEPTEFKYGSMKLWWFVRGGESG